MAADARRSSPAGRQWFGRELTIERAIASRRIALLS